MSAGRQDRRNEFRKGRMSMSGKLRVRERLRLRTSRRWRIVLAALLPAGALLAGVATAAPASADTWGYGLIASKIQFPNNLGAACLDDWDGTQNDYNPVVAYPCSYSDYAQNWAYDESNGTIHPVAQQGVEQPLNSCLDVYAGGGIGNPVDLYPCNGTGAQVWYFRYSDSHGGELVNPQSGDCLDITNAGGNLTYPGGSPESLEVWSCNGGPWQYWYAIPYS
jgi:Ricin-type beta-trefoil lectin domain